LHAEVLRMAKDGLGVNPSFQKNKEKNKEKNIGK
jgi:hypothetical protein